MCSECQGGCAHSYGCTLRVSRWVCALGHHAKIIVPMTENKQLLDIACVIGLVLIYYSSQRSFGIPRVMKQHAVLQVYGYRMQLAGKSSELSTLHSMHNTYIAV